MAKSNVETVTGVTFSEVSFTFDESGKLNGMLSKNENGDFQPVNPNSTDFDTLQNGDEALRAWNIANHGSETDAYLPEGSDVPIVSEEELNAKYDQEYKKFTNAGFIDNTFDTPKPISYTIGQTKSAVDAGGSVIMAYPLDLNPLQDHLKIMRYNYARPDINVSKPPETGVMVKNEEGYENVTGSRRRFVEPYVKGDVEGLGVVGSQLKGSILLPMPKATDVNSAAWGKNELTISGLAALGAAEKGMPVGNFFAGGNFLGQTDEERAENRQLMEESGRSNMANNNATDFISAQYTQFLSKLGSGAFGTEIDADTFLARTGGRVLNPNAEMLFQGPAIRDFAFSFIMIARSKKEGDEIRKIIRFLKVGMAPKFRNSTFLAAPDVFTLHYKNGPGDEAILPTANRFSEGGLALTTMNVDYAPSGYWSAYTDSQPTAVKMDLAFTELKPVYEQDQLDTPEDSVGF